MIGDTYCGNATGGSFVSALTDTVTDYCASSLVLVRNSNNGEDLTCRSVRHDLNGISGKKEGELSEVAASPLAVNRRRVSVNAIE